IIEIEIKKLAPAHPSKPDAKLDPLAVDRAHNTLVFENEQVRVFKGKLAPGEREKWHGHIGAGRAVVLLTPASIRVEAANGDPSPMQGGPGDAFWRDGPIARHRGMNIGNRPCEMVIVEVK